MPSVSLLHPPGQVKSEHHVIAKITALKLLATIFFADVIIVEFCWGQIYHLKSICKSRETAIDHTFLVGVTETS